MEGARGDREHLAWGLVLVSGASAHQFPAGCQGVGVSLGLAVFFGEGLCAGVPGTPASSRILRSRTARAANRASSQDATAVDLSPCETVIYQGRLAYFGAPRCGISDGVLGITLAQRHSGQRDAGRRHSAARQPRGVRRQQHRYLHRNPADLDPVTMQLTATITYLGVSHSSRERTA